MCRLRIRSRRDQNRVPRPPLIDLIKRGIVLGDHEDLLVVLVPGNANQPVIKEGQVRLAHGAHDHRPVLGHDRRRLSQSVVPPFGKRRPRAPENALVHFRPRHEDAENHENQQEDQEASTVEDRRMLLSERRRGSRRRVAEVGERGLERSLVQKRRHFVALAERIGGELKERADVTHHHC